MLYVGNTISPQLKVSLYYRYKMYADRQNTPSVAYLSNASRIRGQLNQLNNHISNTNESTLQFINSGSDISCCNTGHPLYHAIIYRRIGKNRPMQNDTEIINTWLRTNDARKKMWRNYRSFQFNTRYTFCTWQRKKNISPCRMWHMRKTIPI